MYLRSLTVATWDWLGEEGADSLCGWAGTRGRQARCLGRRIEGVLALSVVRFSSVLRRLICLTLVPALLCGPRGGVTAANC